jgi:hypothetical protein
MATPKTRRRTRQGPKSITVTAVPQVQRPSKPPRTPNVEDLEIRSSSRTLSQIASRAADALIEEACKVSIGDVICNASSVLTGKPFPPKRAADLLCDWAWNVGVSVCRKVAVPSPPHKRGNP